MMLLSECVVILLYLCSSFAFSYDFGKLYCYDAFCNVPFSEGYAQHNYLGPKNGYLNLKSNARVSIHARASISSGLVYWIKANKKFGWVPSSVIRETKSFYKDLNFSFEYQDILNVTYFKLQKKTSISRSEARSTALSFKDIWLSLGTCHYNERNAASYKIEPKSASTHEVIDGTTLPVDIITSTSYSSEAGIKPTETLKGVDQLNTGIPDKPQGYSVFDVDAKDIFGDDNEGDEHSSAETEDEINAENESIQKLSTLEPSLEKESILISNTEEVVLKGDSTVGLFSSTIPEPLEVLSVTSSNTSLPDVSLSSSGDSLVDMKEQLNTMTDSVTVVTHASANIASSISDDLKESTVSALSSEIYGESYINEKSNSVSTEVISSKPVDSNLKESSVISSGLHSESIPNIHEKTQFPSVVITSSRLGENQEDNIDFRSGSASVFNSFDKDEAKITHTSSVHLSTNEGGTFGSEKVPDIGSYTTELGSEHGGSSILVEHDFSSEKDATESFGRDISDSYHHNVFASSKDFEGHQTDMSVSTYNPDYIQTSDTGSTIKTLPETYVSDTELKDKDSSVKMDKTDSLLIDVEPAGTFSEYNHDFILAMIPSSLKGVIHDIELEVSLPAALILIIIGSFCVIMLSVYYFLQQLSREGKLKNMIAVLDRELYQLKTAVDLNLPLETLTAGVSSDQQETTRKISADLESEKKINKTLHDTVVKKDKDIVELTKKCEALTEQLNLKGLEISPRAQSLIEEVRGELTMRDEINEKLEAKILGLTSEVDSQKSLIENLTAEKDRIDSSNAELMETAANVTKEKSALEAKVVEHENKVRELEEKVIDLEQEMVKKATQLTLLESTIKSTENDNGVSCVDLMDKVSRLSELEGELYTLKAQKSSLLQQQEADKCKIVELEDEKKSMVDQAFNEKRLYKTLLKEKLDLTTRLEVLTNYYKNKENVLLKELSEFKEKSASSASSTQHYSESMAAMELQLTTYKSKMDSLNTELESQERSYKSLLSQQEKKAHENWLSARQAERKLDEMKQELSQLRGRLTQVEQERLSLISEKSLMQQPPSGGFNKPLANRANSEGDLIQGTDSQGSQFSMPRLDSPPLSLPPFPLLPPPGILPDMNGPFPGMLPPEFTHRHSPPILPHHHHPPPPPPHLFDIRPAPLGRRSPPPFYGDSYPHSMMDDNRSDSGRSRTRGGGSPSSVRSNYSNHRMTPDFESHSSNKNFNPYNAMPRGPADDMHAHPFPAPTKNRMNYVNDYDRDEYYRNGIAPSPPANRRAHEEI